MARYVAEGILPVSLSRNPFITRPMPQKNAPALEQIAAMVKALYAQKQQDYIVELLSFSTFTAELPWDPTIVNDDAYNLTMHVDPVVYIKNYSLLDSIKKVLRSTFNSVSELTFGKLDIYPNYDQFVLVHA